MKIIIFVFILLFAPNASAQNVDDEQKIKDIKAGKSIRRFMNYSDSEREKAPPYRRVFDEYIVDLEHIQKYNEIPNNPKKDEDLAKMSVDGAIALQ